MVVERAERGSRAQLLCGASVAAAVAAGIPSIAQAQSVASAVTAPTTETQTAQTGTAAAATNATAAVVAQTPPAKATSASKSSSEAGTIIVTGSRVARNGYQAPTPVTVLGKSELDAMAKTNLADAVNQVPQLSQSLSPTAQPAGYGGGSIGVNQLNLRALGVSRTLVLQDGKRMIDSALSNKNGSAPDVNVIPSALVTRVDTVTGGASAAYGSDALAGVVNFILDHNFTGIRGVVQGGVSDYGDDRQYLTSLAWGTAFGPDARGHLTLSGEVSYDDGIKGNYRPWNQNAVAVMVNPNWTSTNGLPFYLVAGQAGVSNGTPGGLITSGPLKGVAFGPGGTPFLFHYGLVSPSGNIMSGGDWQYARLDNLVSIDPTLLRKNFFGRLSYELTDNFEVYGEFQWARTNAHTASLPNFLLGAAETVRSDNAFLPPSVAAQMQTLGLQSVHVGSFNADIGNAIARTQRTLTRWNIGADGKFALGGSRWAWDAYYQHNGYNNISAVANDLNIPNFNLAIDAVRDPNTGAIVCRSSLTNPGNGCVPYNPMGTGVNSQAAINYVTGVSSQVQRLTQNVAAINVHGEPFSTWAGPVSLALGGEHRREAVSGSATPLDLAIAFNYGDFLPTFGSYTVTEGYAETVVPLAKDARWAKELELNGAIRATDYSTSGYVTTWKLGATYSPVSDIRFRATRSRDIRAPKLGELFSAGQVSPGASIVDTNGTVYTNSLQISQGNRSLKPEIAKTTEAGVVFSPSFIPGFQASVDWYKIDVAGAIQQPNAQTVVNLCGAGDQLLCSRITRSGGQITIITQPENVLSVKTRGIDFEASYHLPLSSISNDWRGRLGLRVLGTYVLALKTYNTNGTIVEGAGINGGRFGAFGSTVSNGLSTPRFVSTGFLTYDTDRLNAQLSMRYVSAGHYNNAFIQCSSGCPAGNKFTIDNNHIAANAIFNLYVAYKPFQHNDSDIFVAVNNIFNKNPPIIGGNTVNAYYEGQANSDYYDRIGRMFMAGIRIRYK